MMIDPFTVKRLYKQKGLTQREFARESDISYRKMSGILSNGEIKKKEDAHRMAGVLGVSIDAILPLPVNDESVSIDQSGNRNKSKVNYKASESNSDKIADLERKLADLKKVTLEQEIELLKEINRLLIEKK